MRTQGRAALQQPAFRVSADCDTAWQTQWHDTVAARLPGPDDGARDAFGDNMTDPSTRPASARAGFRQGHALAEQIAGFWS